MGNQAHKSEGGVHSHHSNTTSHLPLNHDSHHSSTKATLINCFALGDEMIYYLWRFYDCDNNQVLDKNEMRTFLTELIHTLHDVCLRSELMASTATSNHSSDTTKHLSGAVMPESFSAPSSPKQASHEDQKKFLNLSVNESTSSNMALFTSESESLSENIPHPQIPSEDKKKSRFGFLSRKKKSSTNSSTNRMSVDLSKSPMSVHEQPPPLKSQNSLVKMQMNSDMNAMKRRSVAVVPATGLMQTHNLEQMLTGNTHQDEIRIKWRKIKEKMMTSIDDIIQKTDLDGDGNINYQEFLEFMKHYDASEMLSDIEPSQVTQLLSQPFNLADEDVSTDTSAASEHGHENETKRKSQLLQVLSHSSSLDFSESSKAKKKEYSQGDLFNVAVFGSMKETLELLESNSSNIDKKELNSCLRKAIVDNNCSKARLLLKYGAHVCHSYSDIAATEEMHENLDLLTSSLLTSLRSYSPCMDGSELENFTIILRLLISKGWFCSEPKDENGKEYPPLSSNIIYEAILSYNDSMNMYEDELREALSETRSFEELEQEYSYKFEE
ncbi:hypothetical protein C9374_011040 [Naegleria lovaniensis]|uniref:EF-hand domain-containing protein n=1 Tax=Naegleria lovaniensis TaxID=51637 RepID=A0AA88GG06_NAELO|nr:uncharacterized protein C9374_011040 [Naegleria lovaniensis]KAG2374203.1 hypothetical protein C9374_011040 [Naegleria lovaniensis]